MDDTNELDLFAALALDALDDAERADAERLAAEHPDTASELTRYQEAAAMIGAAVSTPPPVDLGRRLADRAAAARPSGAPTGPWAAPRITSAEGFTRIVHSLDTLLGDLGEAEWALPVAEYPGRTVADMIRHLIGVDRIMAGLLGLDDAHPAPGFEADHLGSTRDIEAALAELTPAELLTLWRRHAQVLVRHVNDHWSTVADTPIAVPSLIALPTSVVLIVRIFEIWTHAEDICRATGRNLVGVDPSQLLLMCPVAVQSAPFGLLMAGHQLHGRTARIVLTGPGGGAWTQALGFGEAPGDVDVLVMAEAIEFCRLVGQRRTPDELAPHIEGDPALAATLLQGVAMFAA